MSLSRGSKEGIRAVLGQAINQAGRAGLPPIGIPDKGPQCRPHYPTCFLPISSFLGHSTKNTFQLRILIDPTAALQ